MMEGRLLGAQTVTATFEQWLQASFDHPPPKTQNDDWYFGEAEDFDSFWEPLGMTDVVTVKYLTRLFLEPQHLTPYSLEQVAEGIWFLIGGSSRSKASHALLNRDIPLEERVNCIQAMADFFRNFVAPLARGPADEDRDDFHGACYMWWHIFPISPTHRGTEHIKPELHGTCLKVLTEILDLPSELCHLSALHGLNHWHELHPKQVEGIIDAFLAKTVDVTPRMREYATKARAGLCQ